MSLVILVAYRLAATLPAFAFWSFWLSTHPGDWQNASVPLLTVLALITVFWVMAGKRLGISQLLGKAGVFFGISLQVLEFVPAFCSEGNRVTDTWPVQTRGGNSGRFGLS